MAALGQHWPTACRSKDGFSGIYPCQSWVVLIEALMGQQQRGGKEKGKEELPKLKDSISY